MSIIGYSTGRHPTYGIETKKKFVGTCDKEGGIRESRFRSPVGENRYRGVNV